MKNFNGTILVAGATGRTGLWMVKSLQTHHIDYHLFVRSGAKAIELFGPEIGRASCRERVSSPV